MEKRNVCIYIVFFLAIFLSFFAYIASADCTYGGNYGSWPCFECSVDSKYSARVTDTFLIKSCSPGTFTSPIFAIYYCGWNYRCKITLSNSSLINSINVVGNYGCDLYSWIGNEAILQCDQQTGLQCYPLNTAPSIFTTANIEIKYNQNSCLYDGNYICDNGIGCVSNRMVSCNNGIAVIVEDCTVSGRVCIQDDIMSAYCGYPRIVDIPKPPTDLLVHIINIIKGWICEKFGFCW